jgi:hypothetical protein
MTPLLLTRSKAETPNTTVSQSSAMMPLTWHMAILVAGTVAAAAVGAPPWLVTTLAILTGGTVLLAWTTYLRLLRSDRDALRSHEGHIPRIVSERAALTTDQGEQRTVMGSRPAVDQTSLPPS